MHTGSGLPEFFRESNIEAFQGGSHLTAGPAPQNRYCELHTGGQEMAWRENSGYCPTHIGTTQDPCRPPYRTSPGSNPGGPTISIDFRIL
jgi:hypothetical protein